MTTITEFRQLLDSTVGAFDDEMGSLDREGVVKAALERYSRDIPDKKTLDITGDGGKYYGIAANLTGWSEDFSRVIEVEYPAATVASDEVPQILNAEDWRDDYWQNVSGTQTRYLYFPNHSPASTETIRVTFSLPYAFSSGAVTIPTQHYYAFGWLMACIYCQQMSAKYARIGDSTLGVDSAAHQTKSENFAARANGFCKMYEQAIGAGTGITGAETGQANRAAGAFVDMDTAPGWPTGRNFVFHGRRTR